jgi:hypothetical protein
LDDEMIFVSIKWNCPTLVDPDILKSFWSTELFKVVVGELIDTVAAAAAERIWQ